MAEDENKFDVVCITEAPEALADAIIWAKENGNRAQVIVHAGGWLTHAYAELSGKQAIKFLNDAWEQGQENIMNYNWIEKGHLTIRITSYNFGIVIGVEADVVRSAESQAQQDKQKEMMTEIYGE